MIRTVIFCLVVMAVATSTAVSQGFQPPAEGKAAIYFVPLKKAGVFEYFHNDKYIGKFKGRNYMRYECDPGKHLFWASSENKEFIEADLNAGGTYIVIVENNAGILLFRVSLTPITQDSIEEFMKIKELVMKKAPTITPVEKLSERNLELQYFIADKLDMYHTIWKDHYSYGKITPDMAIPAESLK